MREAASSRKGLAFTVALTLVFSLVMPLVGTAVAQQATTVTGIDITPDQDTAATGTCNEFIITVTGQNAQGQAQAPQGQTVTVTLTQTDQRNGQTLTIGFCDADTTQQGATGPGSTNAFTAQQNPPTSQVTGPQASGRDNNDQVQTTGQCVTDANGQCELGVFATDVGQMAIQAQTEQNGNIFRANATKTWVQGGQAAVTAVDCEPEADQNLEGQQHTFTCTAFTTDPATGQNTVTVAGVQVSFDVTAGPNAEEIGPTPCGVTGQAGGGGGGTATQTNNQGQVQCTYQDAPIGTPGATAANASPPGTDTIIAFVQQCPPNATQCTAGPDPFEPQDQLAKTWVGPARNINCEPNNASNPSGTSHTVTCTVTDVAGQALQNVGVQFAERGPGRFGAGQDVQTVVTGPNGQASITTTTQQGETGTQEITGTILNCQGQAGGFTNEQGQCPGGFQTAAATNVQEECEQPAGQTTTPGAANAPAGQQPTAQNASFPNAPAGNCAETVLKTWQQAGTPTQTPTATVTGPPEGGFALRVTLEASKQRKTFGRTFSLAGTITPEDAETAGQARQCVENVTVTLSRQIVGTENFVELETTQSDENGAFAFNRTADASAQYVASVEQQTGPNGEALCAEASSSPERVNVRKDVDIRKRPRGRVARGTRVRIIVSVQPCGDHAGDPITLWKAIAGTMARVGGKASNANCQATFRRVIRRNSVFQGRSPKSDADHLGGKSNKLGIQTRRG